MKRNQDPRMVKVEVIEPCVLAIVDEPRRCLAVGEKLELDVDTDDFFNLMSNGRVKLLSPMPPPLEGARQQNLNMRGFTAPAAHASFTQDF